MMSPTKAWVVMTNSLLSIQTYDESNPSTSNIFLSSSIDEAILKEEQMVRGITKVCDSLFL